jgi:hypothetical protein
MGGSLRQQQRGSLRVQHDGNKNGGRGQCLATQPVFVHRQSLTRFGSKTGPQLLQINKHVCN